MVVKKKDLFRGETFDEFIPFGKVDFISRILDNYHFAKREGIEDNLDFKQPVAYVSIINPLTGQVFVSQRSSNKHHYHERRLYGNWGIGVGGHIRIHDALYGNPIWNSVLRELDEEIDFGAGFSKNLNLKLLGYINSNNEVGQYHFGLLYVFLTDCDNVKPKSKEIETGKLENIVGVKELLFSDGKYVEDWARISLEPVVKYFFDNFNFGPTDEDGMSWFFKSVNINKRRDEIGRI